MSSSRDNYTTIDCEQQKQQQQQQHSVDEENGTASASSTADTNNHSNNDKGHGAAVAVQSPNKKKKNKIKKQNPQHHQYGKLRNSSNDNNKNNNKGCCCCLPKKKIVLTKLLTARILFILCLAGVAGGLGYAAYRFLSESEEALAEKQFGSIAERALSAAQAITLRKRMGGVSLATIFSHTHPNAVDWPNVALDGFNDIALDLIITSDGRGMGFMPIVQPDQVQSFEDFAYNYYETQQRPPFQYPNTTIPNSSFGRGIYGTDRSLNTSDNRYHAIGGKYNKWGGQHQFVAPILQLQGSTPGPDTSLLLFDHYSLEARGRFIDDMIACADQRQTTGDLSMQCTSLSDALFLIGQPDRPGALIFEPIYPANDPDVFTGYISSSIIWDEVLENIFAEEVSGIECILQTETQNHTYRITNGHPTYIGEKEHYSQEKHCNARGVEPMSIVITGDGLFTDASARYTLRLYPTEEFFETYSTRNPASATVGAVVTIIITSLAFLVYDALVRQEFNDARAVLEAKRQFMRYVSHEVMTPLNTVVMGLRLLQEEVLDALVSGRKRAPPLAIDNGGSSNNNNHHHHHEKGKPTTGYTTIGKAAAVTQSRTEPAEETKSASIIDLSNRILTSAESAVSVLNDLLNYDKIEMGELPLELTIVPIWSLIEKSMAEFILPFQAKKINFTLDFSSLMAHDNHGDIESQLESATTRSGAKDLPREVQERRVVGDAIRLTQVLRNLTSNALKFTPENGSVVVKVSWRKGDLKQAVDDSFVLQNSDNPVTFKRDGWLEVAVQDSGVGLTEDQLSRLFQRGMQFNANELQAGKGSGLGLYIAKGICERHGGSLIPTSEGIDKGTTFTLAIPLHHIPESALPNNCRRASLAQKQAPETKNSAAISNRNVKRSASSEEGGDDKLRILVVDDAAMNRKLLARLLTNSGHQCDQAEDGQQAVERVKASLSNNLPYQVILMDFEMPVMNGPDAVKVIREELGCTDPFIGGVTGNVLPDDVAHFKRCGADWVFCKPVRIHDLEAIWMDYGVITGSGRSVDIDKSANTQGTAPTHATDEP